MTTLCDDVFLVSVFSVAFLSPAAAKWHQHSIGRASRAAQLQDVYMQGSQHRQDKPFGADRRPTPAGHAFRCRPLASAGQAFRRKPCVSCLRDCQTTAAAALQARACRTGNTGRTSLSMSTACIGS